MTTPFIAPNTPEFAALLEKTPRHSVQVSNFGETPSQTVGPYFAYGLTAQQYGYDFGQAFGSVLAQPHAQGQHIQLEGRVFDGDGNPIPDAIVEISHANAQGQYPATEADALAQGFSAFGRCGTGTDAQNRFIFQTLMPGPEAPDSAPFIHICITMRGLLMHTFTRIYFEGIAANETDAVLQAVPAERRATLLARSIAPNHYQFNIHMQGPAETVFFDM